MRSTRSRIPLALGLLAVLLVVVSVATALTLAMGPGAAVGQPSGSPAAVAEAPGSHQAVQPSHARDVPSPSAAPLHRVGDRIVIAGIQAQTVVRVEQWDGRPDPVRRGLAVRVRIEALKDDANFDFQNFQVVDQAGGRFPAQSPGKQPALAYGKLPLGGEVVGWVTFLVPPDDPYVLTVRTPLGYNGLDQTTTVALDPINPASPDPTPAPTRSPSPNPTPPRGLANWGYPTTIDSTYYSGFGAAPPTSSVSEVRGSWTEPTVRCSGSGDRLAGFWVGIEDNRGRYLQQLGTAAICHGTAAPTYYAWYEMFPLPTVPITMRIHPGDRMTATVSVKGSAWRLTLKDGSTGATFAITKNRTADAAIALWIAEAPSSSTSELGLHVLPLANYGTVTFTGCSAVVGGTRRTITDPAWAHFRFDMSTSTGLPKAVTTDVARNGTTFSSSWRRS
jgi:hypothetical protein